MVKLTAKDVKHVASLARLDLKKDEINKFKEQLSEVINFVESLREVDTSGIEPTSQTTGLENVTREDKASTANSLTQEQSLSGTEKVHNGYFVVDAILTPKGDQ